MHGVIILLVAGLLYMLIALINV